MCLEEVEGMFLHKFADLPRLSALSSSRDVMATQSYQTCRGSNQLEPNETPLWCKFTSLVRIKLKPEISVFHPTLAALFHSPF